MNIDRTLRPAIHELEDINILRPERAIMPNKVPVNIICAGEQDVVRMDILFEGGSWQQSHKLQALFANRMLREGSRKYTSSDIAERLDYYGAWLELTSSMEFAYITLYSLNKYFPETLEIIESIVKEPLFPEKELGTVIETNVQQFLINSSKVDFLAHRAMMSTLFGTDHPCGRFAVEEDYRKVDSQMLKEFHGQYYHSGNCFIYLSGKVTDEIVRKVESTFGTESFGSVGCPLAELNYPLVTSPRKRIFIEHADSLQSAVKVCDFAITRSHPDYHKLGVLITLFGGYFGSRLMSNIREDKGYTYGISAGILHYPHTGLMVVSSETGNVYVEPLINEVYREIEILQNEQVSKEELAIVKNYMLGEMCRSYESPFSLADAWMFIHTSRLTDDFFESSLQAIKDISAIEIQNLANLYLCKESLKEVVAGKKIL